MDTYGTLGRPPRWRPWLRAAAFALGGLLVAAATAVLVYSLVMCVVFIVMVIAMNGFGSNK
jgi:hypothetical protein